jgi:hypothetical protein
MKPPDYALTLIAMLLPAPPVANSLIYDRGRVCVSHQYVYLI